MIYADSDFFLALLKESDWLKHPAEVLLEKHAGEIVASPATLIELMLLAHRLSLDPERLLNDALEIATLEDDSVDPYMLAAHYMKTKSVGVFDALHAVFCGRGRKIISSDRVFDRLGLKRICLQPDEAA